MTGYCGFACKNRSEKGFKIIRSLQIYIERTYGKDLHKNEAYFTGKYILALT